MLTVRRLQRIGLEPVAFELADGECVAVRGGSGSGKTLLLRALADLDPNEGDVALDGADRDAMTAPAWRRRVAYVPAESGWWTTEVGGHFEDWERAAPIVARLGLPEAARGWDVGRLSTGERQRLALVRALARDPAPRVLLLDEPTSGVDANGTTAIETLVGEHLAAGGAALWVTHDDAQSRRVARRVLVVENGCVREVSP